MQARTLDSGLLAWKHRQFRSKSRVYFEILEKLRTLVLLRLLDGYAKYDTSGFEAVETGEAKGSVNADALQGLRDGGLREPVEKGKTVLTYT